eukprot:gene895-1254_t
MRLHRRSGREDGRGAAAVCGARGGHCATGGCRPHRRPLPRSAHRLQGAPADRVCGGLAQVQRRQDPAPRAARHGVTMGVDAPPLQIPRPISAVTRLGALLLRVQAAGLGPLVIHRAQPRLGVEKIAVPTGPPRHREDRVLVVEVVNQPRLLQPLGNVADFFMLGLERVHQFQPHQ